MNIQIEIAPTVSIPALAYALQQIGNELYSTRRGHIAVRPGRPRMVRGGNRRRATA